MVVVDLIWLGVPLLFAFIVLGVFAIADRRSFRRRLARPSARLLASRAMEDLGVRRPASVIFQAELPVPVTNLEI